METKHVTKFAVLLLVLFGCVLAFNLSRAEAQISQPKELAVFDSTPAASGGPKKVGDVVGADIGVTTVAFQIGQQVAVLNVKANGFEGNQSIGFQSNNCTGTPFFLLGGGTAPPTMSVLGLAALLNSINFVMPGQTIFVPVSPPTIQPLAMNSQLSFQPFLACTPIFGGTFNAVQAVSTGVDLSTEFAQPFTLRATSNVLLGF